MQSLTEFSLSPLEWHRQARQWYMEMLEKQPVYFDEGSQCWWVFRHEHVSQVLKDWKTFSSERKMMGSNDETILTLDPPRHQQLRSLVSLAFSPRTIQQMEQSIEAITEELLDRVIPQGHMDVMTDLAHPLPVMVIAEMLGLPKEDWQRLKAWSDILLGDFTQEAKDPSKEEGENWLPVEVIQDINTYFWQALEERRRQPRQDLMSLMLAAEIEGERLSTEQLLSFCVTLLVAGNVTTTNLLGNAVLCLDTFSEAADELRHNPDLMPSAIEEVLRYLPPIRKPGENNNVIIGRTVTRDTHIGDQLIRQGETVTTALAAANFDRRQFPDPERFDIHREPNRHLSFGHGVHFCIGAPLSRLENKIALKMMLKRLPGLRVAPGATIEQVRSGVVFGVKNLPVEFDA